MSLSRLAQRPDFQRQPFSALTKRLVWRLRWSLTSRPWRISCAGGFKISVPRGGAGALIYYQGVSEPESSYFVSRFLESGMTFVDVGSHIGEYVLLAYPHLAPGGSVHAFEPHPAVFTLLKQNVNENGLANVFLNRCAVSNTEGAIAFQLAEEPSTSCLRPDWTWKTNSRKQSLEANVIKSHSLSLDCYCALHGIRPHLIKIDVEGAELLVLQGAEKLLSLPKNNAPTILFEYHIPNYEQFGYSPGELFDFLGNHEYSTFVYTTHGNLHVVDRDSRFPRCKNLIAAKNEQSLRHRLERCQKAAWDSGTSGP